jgi:hypothetical protein
MRLRPDWSGNAVGKVLLLKVASSLSRSPSAYIAEATVTPDSAGWDGQSRYVPANLSLRLGCRQLNDSGETVIIDAWATHALINLPPGAQLPSLNFSGGGA